MLKKWNKKYWAGMGVILALTGCTSVADMVGYDTATLNEDAAKSYTQVIQKARGQKALDVSSPTAQRVQRVFARLRPHAERANKTGVPFNWQMNVIRSDEMNAWAMPGGKMAFYTGLVESLNLTDDEIATVMGHEMAHALKEHGKKKANLSQFTNVIAGVGHEMTHALLEHSKKALGGQVLTGLGGSILASSTGVDGDLVGLGADLLATKPFSRYQESEADAGGVRLMAEAGYNPEAAVSVWEKMNKVQGGSSLAILSTHPTNQARINAIRKMLPEVMPIYQKNKR